MARAPYTDKSRYSATATATITASNAAMNIIATVNNGAEVLAYGMSSSRMLKVMCSPGLGTYKWLIQSGADQRQKSEMGVRTHELTKQTQVQVSETSLYRFMKH